MRGARLSLLLITTRDEWRPHKPNGPSMRRGHGRKASANHAVCRQISLRNWTGDRRPADHYDRRRGAGALDRALRYAPCALRHSAGESRANGRFITARALRARRQCDGAPDAWRETDG